MKNLERKPFEECKIELIELGDDIIVTSEWSSEGGTTYPGDGGSQTED